MTEAIQPIPPGEKLRSFLIRDLPEEVRQGSPENLSWQVANNMPWMAGFIRTLSPEYPDKKAQKFCREKLTLVAEEVGLGSIDSLVGAISELKAQLKQELSEHDWDVFFGEKKT